MPPLTGGIADHFIKREIKKIIFLIISVPLSSLKTETELKLQIKTHSQEDTEQISMILQANNALCQRLPIHSTIIVAR